MLNSYYTYEMLSFIYYTGNTWLAVVYRLCVHPYKASHVGIMIMFITRRLT